MTDLKLSIFKDLQSYESKAVGLDTVLWWIKSDQSVKDKTNGNGKQTTHVTRVTGLSICDIDHVEESQMETVRGKIWSDSHTVLAYTTISGEGFRVIFAYVGEQGSPPENGILYRAAYKKGNQYYADLCGVEYDGQCSNITRLSGMAHDPEACLNSQAEPFLITDDEAAAANTAADTERGKHRAEDAGKTCWHGLPRTGTTTTRSSARASSAGSTRTGSTNMAAGASARAAA